MLHVTDILAILKQIQYRDWEINLRGIYAEGDASMYLQVEFDAPCEKDGFVRRQRGRKWYISEHMTQSEIVATALKAVLTCEEHEARERFKWKGRAIFGPHIDVEALWAACLREDARPPT